MILLISLLIAIASAFDSNRFVLAYKSVFTPDNSHLIPIISERRDIVAEQKRLAAEAEAQAKRIAEANNVPALPRVSPTIVVSPLLKMVNDYRISIGLNPVTEDSNLTASAAVQASQMNSSNWSIHSRSGEIQGGSYGHADTESVQLNGWINSPPHYSIMTDNYSRAGCAKATTPPWTWFVCHFG